MIRTLPVALCAVLMVSGCGSRMNPMNWFPSGPAAPADAVASEAQMTEIIAAANSENLIAGIKELKAEAIPGGIILRAVGVAQTQQHHSAELVAFPTPDAGVMEFDFVALPPEVRAPVGTEATREITVAIKLTNAGLEGISQLRVRSASNVLTVRR